MTPPNAERVADLVSADAARFEHIAAQLRLVLCALGMLTIVGNWESNSAANVTFVSASTLVFTAWAGLIFFRTRAASAPGWTKWVSAVVDVSFVTAFAAGSYLNYSGAYEMLLAPLLVALYPLVMFLSAMGGNLGVSLLAGALAAVQRLALLRLAVDRGDVVPSNDAVYGQQVVSLPDQYTIVGFLFVLGVVCGGLGRLLRQQWTRSATETLEKQEAERQQRHFRKYLSAAVAQYVADNPDAMGLVGRRRRAAVMFVDIRDFTRRSEAERPEVVVEFLNTVFGALVPIVFAHGGTLDKFLGDGLMAVFGVPREMSDASLEATRAAVAMLDRVAELHAAGVGGAFGLHISVGIAFGDVIAGNVGTAERIEFTVIGDTVNFAARLQGLCRDLGRSLVISDEVHDAVRDHFPCAPMPPIRVKGKSGTPKIWAVIRPGEGVGVLQGA
jgi:adenylate cyclase